MRQFTHQLYIYHPMRVSSAVCLIDGVTEEVVAAAWLHDTIEDCEVSAEDIEKEFGSNVMRLVVELTNPSIGSKLPRKDRKAMDRKNIASASRWAKIIKAIDRLDNLREMSGAKSGFKKLYAEESRLLCEALLANNETDEVICSYVKLIDDEIKNLLGP